MRLGGGKPPRPWGGGGGGTLLYERVRTGGGGKGLVVGAGRELDARVGGCKDGEDRERTPSPPGLCEGDALSLPRVVVRPAYLCRAYCFIDSLMR